MVRRSELCELKIAHSILAKTLIKKYHVFFDLSHELPAKFSESLMFIKCNCSSI